MQKMIVFDLNCTLLKRIKKSDKDTIQELQNNNVIPNGSQANNYVYLRPHLDTLADFLHTHNVRYIFWSTCMKHNTEKIIKIVEPILYKHNGFLCQDHCIKGDIKGDIKAENWVKNLDVVNQIYKTDAILVDDSVLKRYKDQPMIIANEFTGFYDDYLLRLTQELHKMTDCSDKTCIFHNKSISSR